MSYTAGQRVRYVTREVEATVVSVSGNEVVVKVDTEWVPFTTYEWNLLPLLCDHLTSVNAFSEGDWDDVTQRCVDCGAHFDPQDDADDYDEEYARSLGHPDDDFDREVLLAASHANPDLAFFPGEDY